MRRAPRQILRCDPHRLLTMFPIAFTHGHARTLREDEQISREKYRGHFYHGLLDGIDLGASLSGLTRYK